MSVGGFIAKILKVSKLPQLRKDAVPIDVIELGIVIEERLPQFPNADWPILLTEFEIVTEVRLSQLSKAIYPIEVTELPTLLSRKNGLKVL